MTTSTTVHDPVCHMDIDPTTAAGSSEYEGATYYFCSRGCKLDFDEDPAGVLKAEAEYDHSQPMDARHDDGSQRRPRRSRGGSSGRRHVSRSYQCSVLAAGRGSPQVEACGIRVLVHA